MPQPAHDAGEVLELRGRHRRQAERRGHRGDAAAEAEREAATRQAVHRRRVGRGHDRVARVVVRGRRGDLQRRRRRAERARQRRRLLHVEALGDERPAEAEPLAVARLLDQLVRIGRRAGERVVAEVVERCRDMDAMRPRRRPVRGTGCAAGRIDPVPDPVIDPAIVDLDRVAAWMDDRALGDGPITDVELIAGGTQNVLLRFRRGEREFVLRRPPPHKRANSDETMRREARVLGRPRRHRRAAPGPDRRRARPRRDRRGVLPDGARRRVQRHARPAGAARVGRRDAARDGPVDGRRDRRPRPRRPRGGRADRPRQARRLGRAPGAAVAQAARRLQRAAGLPGPVDPAPRRRRRVARRAPPRRHPDGAHPRRLPLRQRADLAAPRARWRRSSTGS